MSIVLNGGQGPVINGDTPDAAGALPSGTGFVTVSSGTGGVLTASSTSAADLRTALGALREAAGR